MHHDERDNNHVEKDVLAHEVDVGPATDSILVLLVGHPVSVAEEMHSHNGDGEFIEDLNVVSKLTIHGQSMTIIHVDGNIHEHDQLNLLTREVYDVEGNTYKQIPS